MRNAIFTIVLLLIATISYAQPMEQDIDMKINAVGDADIKISMQMNPAQWQAWYQTVGNNPDAIKAEMEQSLPTLFLEDFDLNINNRQKSFDLTMKASGVCSVDENGNWYLETDQKGLKVNQLDEGSFEYVTSPPEMGGMLVQRTNLKFPGVVSNVKVAEDEFGKTIFTFDMDKPKGGGGIGHMIMQYAGFLLLLVGIVLFIRALISEG